MSKSNKGNPDIVKYKKDFGSEGGADPSEAGKLGAKKTNSIRKAVRRIAAMEVGFAMSLTEKQVMEKLTMAEAVALSKFRAALGGDVKAMKELEDSVDGKIVEQRVHAEVTLADLVTGSLEYDEEFKEPIDAEFETAEPSDSQVEA